MVVLAGCSGDTEQAATSSTSSTPAATTSSAPTPSTTPSPTSETSSTSEEPTSEEPTTSAPPPTSTPSSTTRRTRTATPTERDDETETDEPERESETATPTRGETPRGRIVRIDDYCDDTPWEVARTADGRTAYCVQVSGTDAYVWSRRRAVRPVDPNVPEPDPENSLNGPVAGEPCNWEGIPGYDVDGRRYMCVEQGDGVSVWRRAD